MASKVISAAIAVAIAFTAFEFSPAMAAPKSAAPSATDQTSISDATDFSSRKRRRYYRNDAAAAAAMVGVIGAIGAIAAEREYRKSRERRYRERHYGYYGGGYGCGPGMNSDGWGNCVPIGVRRGYYRY
jgi:hypothetical protein